MRFGPLIVCLGLSCLAFYGGSERPLYAGRIYTDHIGYDRIAPKTAVLELASGQQGAEARSFELVSGQSGEVVFEGPLGARQGVRDWGGNTYREIDFSAFAGEGDVKIRVLFDGGSRLESQPFQVGAGLHFRRSFDKAFEYFNRSRAVSEPAWSWDRALRIIGNGGMAPVNLQGGWYDASGDISKYLSHLSYANYLNPQQIPLTAWALAAVSERNASLPQNRPDQGRRLLEEAQFGADFLARMQSSEGYFYISVFDRWRGDQYNRHISVPVGSGGTQNGQVQAAYREGGGLAIAALARTAGLTAPGNAPLAARYLSAAQAGFAHLERNNRRYCDDGKENIIDDYAALLAATELALATGDPSYRDAARRRAANLIGRLGPGGYFFSDAEDVRPEARSRPFWHASDAGLPVVALARYLDLEDGAAEIAAAKQAIKRHLEYQLEVNREVANPFNYARQHFRFQGRTRSGFFIPQENETGYWWQGENARLGSLATAAVLGGRKVYGDDTQAQLPSELLAFAADQIGWILGKNPFDMSFMASVGRNNPPAYSAGKPGHGHLPGGIANGITGRSSDGSGIAWNAGGGWENWRWVEQWLPHTTWYLLAISALAELDSP
jgi:hypothetical protein